jgi:threonine dehydrogenase-like Zn-dependent dehydrogenase
MKALVWCAPYNVSVENVPDPKILNRRDAIVRVTSTAICGSDLHLYDGFIPAMRPGDILGHEFMGVVEEVGPDVDRSRIAVGDRVIVPFPIACGSCFFCKRQLWSCCDNTNPKAAIAETVYGFATSGIYGYSHIMGGYAGGQAQYVRTPFADVNLQKIPDGLTDDQVLFLTDIFPTGYMAVEHCNIKPDDTVAIWGCGPVGQFAIRSAVMLGARQVIAIDDGKMVPERLEMARRGGAVTIDMNDEYVYDRIRDLTGGMGADVCVDAVGMEAHGMSLDALYDKVKTVTFLGTDRAHALRQAINCCRKAGTLSVPGVYNFPDKVPVGAMMNKALTVKTGQTHVHKYVPILLNRIRKGEIDPTFVITHRMPLSKAAHGYEIFNEKRDGCIKIVLDPAA